MLYCLFESGFIVDTGSSIILALMFFLDLSVFNLLTITFICMCAIYSK